MEKERVRKCFREDFLKRTTFYTTSPKLGGMNARNFRELLVNWSVIAHSQRNSDVIRSRFKKCAFYNALDGSENELIAIRGVDGYSINEEIPDAVIAALETKRSLEGDHKKRKKQQPNTQPSKREKRQEANKRKRRERRAGGQREASHEEQKLLGSDSDEESMPLREVRAIRMARQKAVVGSIVDRKEPENSKVGEAEREIEERALLELLGLDTEEEESRSLLALEGLELLSPDASDVDSDVDSDMERSESDDGDEITADTARDRDRDRESSRGSGGEIGDRR